MKEVLRNKHNVQIGTLTTEGNVVTLRDRHNNKLGTFNRSQNETRDKNGRLISRGNTLVSLLKE